MNPLVLCVLAVGAAFAAALAGHLLSPARRARRARRRRTQELAAARYRVVGTLTVMPESWTAFWYDHQLDTLDAPGGGA